MQTIGSGRCNEEQQQLDVYFSHCWSCLVLPRTLNPWCIVAGIEPAGHTGKGAL